MSAENNVNESKPLEVPEVVPGAAAVEFPEINDFLSRMRIRSGLFGFQKEDVFAKMQELNTLYQNRLQQMRDQTRGQLKQMKKQYQEVMNHINLASRLGTTKSAMFEDVDNMMAQIPPLIKEHSSQKG